MFYRWLGRFVFIFFYPFWRLKLSGSKRTYIVFIREDNQLLFVKNWLGNGRWQLPGGGLKPGETHRSGLVREVWEELKIKLEPAALRKLTSGSHRGCRYMVYCCYLRQVPAMTLNKWEIVAAQWSGSSQQLPLEVPAARALRRLDTEAR